jgi:ATP-dependent Lhr-like helicase
MKKALEEDVCYPYLTPRAQKVLEAARSLARESGMLESSILPCGENSFYFCPWVGSKTMKTIKCLLSCGLKEPLQIYSVFGGDHYLQITSGFSGTDLFRRMAELSIDLDDPDMVLPEDQIPQVDKYDTMIPGELLRSAFLHNELDMESAIDVLKDVEIYS